MRPLLILARVSWASSSPFGEGVEEVPGATGTGENGMPA